jgi:hypothetical protein
MMADPRPIGADTAPEEIWVFSNVAAKPGQRQVRAGVPSRLSAAAAIVRQASCNAGRVTMALVLACACAQAADPDKVLRVEFYVAETRFGPG